MPSHRHVTSVALLAALSVVGGGCSLALRNDFRFAEDDAAQPTDGGAREDAPRGDAGTDDAGVGDGGPRDAGPDAPMGECARDGDCDPRPFATATCEAGACVYTCQAGRDDCNRVATDGCETDLANDPANCGRCGGICAAEGTTATCEAGHCAFACVPGRADCDRESPDCETALGTVAACRGCGDACGMGELCSTLSDPAHCTLDCPAPAQICDGSCVDVQRSVPHCGGCGRACEGGRAVWSCASGRCEVASCDVGAGDCDSDHTNGCETDVLTSTAHCGACGRVCAPARAVPACVAGGCGIARCDVGYGDCNADPADGCEADLVRSAASCGACGRVCADGGPCVDGRCDPVRSSVPGPEHSCLLRESGRALCWGTNEAGQLGDGTTDARTLPGPVTTSLRFARLSLGLSFTCGIEAGTGRLYCWGRNGYGELGDGTFANRTTPVPVVARAGEEVTFAGRRFTDVQALESGACALDDAGEVWCWGRNGYGQVGDGTMTNQGRAGRVMGLAGVVSIAAGARHACARLGSGEVRCWGDNTLGQLGDGTTTTRSAHAPVMGLAAATRLVASSYATCALAGGEVWCWGRNTEGELGRTGPGTNIPVSTGVTATELVCGAGSCFARTASGWRAWGSRLYGELGDGIEGAAPTTPVSVPHDATSAIFTTSGSRTACQIIDHTLRCWGLDSSGQIGARDLVVRGPTRVSDADGPLAATSGGAGPTASCFLVDNVVRCAGRNNTGSLGGFSPYATARPIAVASLPARGRSVDVGENYACAVVGADGSRALWCWGSAPGIAASPVPAPVPSITGAEPLEVSAGRRHVCARYRASGDLVVGCWGTDGAGELGRGVPGGTHTMPALVMSGFTDVAEVEAGNGASCLRRMGGEVHCWGDNTFGQLGNGMVGGSASTPVAVVGLTDAVDVALGDGFACAARSTGRVVCWGKNTSGQLGTSGGNRGTIDDVSGLPDASPATAVAASGTHACAVLSGAVWCWGANDLGQLGQGDRAPYAAPVAVVGLTGVTSVFGAQGTSVGPRHTCATLAGGGVSCWGAALFGRLGSGEPLWSATPLTAVVP